MKSPVFSIILKTENLSFSNFADPGNIGNLLFLISHMVEIRAVGGRLQGLGSGGLDYLWNMFPGISGYPGNIGNILFLYFCDFYKKRCAPRFHAEPRRPRAEISHMRPTQAPKLKLRKVHIYALSIVYPPPCLKHVWRVRSLLYVFVHPCSVILSQIILI